MSIKILAPYSERILSENFTNFIKTVKLLKKMLVQIAHKSNHAIKTNYNSDFKGNK